jgi:hypothetical protein
LLFDRPSRPDGLDDLISRDEVTWLVDQHAENVERPPADRQRRENTLLISPVQNTAALAPASRRRSAINPA